MALSKSQFDLLLQGMSDVKSELREDIRDINTTVTVLATSSAEVKGVVSLLKEDVAKQWEKIELLNKGQVLSDSQIRTLSKKTSKKSDSSIPALLKNSLSKKMLASVIIGLITLIGLAGYFFFVQIFGREVGITDLLI